MAKNPPFPPDPQPVTLILVPWRRKAIEGGVRFTGYDMLVIARWDVEIYSRHCSGGPCLFTTSFNSRGNALAKLRYLMMRELGRHFEWEITTTKEDS